MHHSRRRSGHGLPNTSTTDVRKAAPAVDAKHKSAKPPPSSSRRTADKQLPGSKLARSSSSRDLEKDSDDEPWFDDERESFPQFCTTCEKQFVTKDDRFLYCSEACRDYDQEYGTISTQHFMDSANSRGYSVYAVDASEPRDIIPRASPSRPSSTYFSPPSTPAKPSSTLPTSSAIAALRSLSIRDASPPSPSHAHSVSGIWPFSTRSAVTSPSSYTRSSNLFSSTYDNGYYRTGASNYYGAPGPSGHERPLPPRRPGSYSRPKSIELVTPLIGQ